MVGLGFLDLGGGVQKSRRGWDEFGLIWEATH